MRKLSIFLTRLNIIKHGANSGFLHMVNMSNIKYNSQCKTLLRISKINHRTLQLHVFRGTLSVLIDIVASYFSIYTTYETNFSVHNLFYAT